MNQIKVNRKKDRFSVEIKCGKTQTVNHWEADRIAQSGDAAFLPFTIREGKAACRICYGAQGLIALPDFLKTAVLSGRMFCRIADQLVRFDRLLEEDHLKKSAALYDARCMPIDPDSLQISFVYVPIQPFESEKTLQTGLRELLRFAVFDPNEDLTYVQEFIRLVGSDSGFSAFLLQDLLQKGQSAQPPDAERAVCSACGFSLKAGESCCPLCGKKQNVNRDAENAAALLYRRSPLAASSEKESPSAAGFTVHEDENGRVTVFKAPRSSSGHGACLCRDGSRIRMEQFPFRIGKQPDVVDLCLKNHAVSRRHAEILREESRFYLVDLGSTNGTWVNGRRLRPGEKERIFSRAQITFANETFMFITGEDE